MTEAPARAPSVPLRTTEAVRLLLVRIEALEPWERGGVALHSGKEAQRLQLEGAPGYAGVLDALEDLALAVSASGGQPMVSEDAAGLEQLSQQTAVVRLRVCVAALGFASRLAFYTELVTQQRTAARAGDDLLLDVWSALDDVVVEASEPLMGGEPG